MKQKVIYLSFYATFLRFTSCAVDLVLDPIGSFRYGDRMIRIWPCAKNGPDIPTSFWGFRYDPVMLPIVDGKNSIILTTTKLSSRWRTELVLVKDDSAVSKTALKRIQALYKNVEGMQSESVFALPVKKTTIEFPGLFEDFLDVNLTSIAKPCPDRAICFTAPPNKLRVTFYSPAKKRALELEEALRSSHIHYEVQSYASIRKNFGSKVDTSAVFEDYSETLEPIHGHLDLSTTAGMPLLYPTTKEMENKLLEDFIQNSKLNLSSIEASVSTNTTLPTGDTLQLEFLKRSFSKELVKQIRNVETNLTGRLDAIDSKLWSQVKEIESKLLEVVHNKSVRLIGRTLCEFSGWKVFCIDEQCSCYKYIEESLDWTSAEENCKKLSSHLASIHSGEENDFVFKLVIDDTFLWIGLNDRQSDGIYVWSDGSPMNYTNWRSDQPDGSSNQNCVGHYPGSNNKWHDLDCNNSQRSVCKRRI